MLAQFPISIPTEEQPLSLLHAGHLRIEGMLTSLLGGAERLRGKGPDRLAAAGEVQSALAGLESALVAHHQDEEASIFPRLLRGSPQHADLIAVVTHEHRLLEHLLRQAEQLGEAAAQRDATGFSPTVAAELRWVALELIRLHDQHHQTEETVLLPLAEVVLGRSELAQIGAEMVERRSLRLTLASPPRPPAEGEGWD